MSIVTITCWPFAKGQASNKVKCGIAEGRAELEITAAGHSILGNGQDFKCYRVLNVRPNLYNDQSN